MGAALVAVSFAVVASCDGREVLLGDAIDSLSLDSTDAQHADFVDPVDENADGCGPEGGGMVLAAPPTRKTDEPKTSYAPSFVWTGNGFCIAWADDRHQQLRDLLRPLLRGRTGPSKTILPSYGRAANSS